METYTKKTSSGTDIVVCILVDDRAQTVGVHPLDRSLNIVNSSRIIGVALPADNPRPTVLILGWYGASKRNLAKYEIIYHAMGYNTVSTAAPTSITFSAANPRPYLLSILRVLATDERLLAGGLVIAPFSMSGAILIPPLARMLWELPADHTLERELGLRKEDHPVLNAVRDSVAALVFDSCPCYMHLEISANALVQGLQVRNSWLEFCIRLGFYVFFIIHRALNGDVPVQFWEAMRSTKYPCPELYMYSAADALLDDHALSELVAHRRHAGISNFIEVWRVEDAPHVMLMRAHRDQYISRLRRMNDWGVNARRTRKRLPFWTLPEEDLRL